MSAVSTDRETVLVVEDEKHLADLYTDHLTDRYAVRTAYSGEEAIEMLADDYLVKPVSNNALRKVVDQLLTVTQYSERLQELTSKKLKRNVLCVEKPESELREGERYAELEADIDRLEETLHDLSEDLLGRR